MGSKEEAKRYKRKAIRFDQESSKKLKSSEEVIKEAKYTDEILKEKIKEMMQLIPIEEVYVESLQVKHPIIDWKVYKEGQRSYWKIIRLGGSSACYQFFVDLLKHLDRLYEPDSEVQLWTQTQNFMHAPIEWKLYDLSGVHQVTAKYKEILMLVEKDYPLRKGLALVMICYKLQVENFSQMANDLVLKIYKIANSPRQQEGTSHCLKKNATAKRKLVPLLEDCTDVIVKKKLSVKDDSFLKISALCPALYSSSNRSASDGKGKKKGRTVTLTTNCTRAMGCNSKNIRWAPKSQDRGRRDNYRHGSKVKEHAPKALMAIDGVGWDWNYMANDDENHALVADEEAPSEFALMAKTSADSEVFDNSIF
nr:hypothetical protein [Tanacetum cinerariifolium]